MIDHDSTKSKLGMTWSQVKKVLKHYGSDQGIHILVRVLRDKCEDGTSISRQESGTDME